MGSRILDMSSISLTAGVASTSNFRYLQKCALAPNTPKGRDRLKRYDFQALLLIRAIQVSQVPQGSIGGARDRRSDGSSMRSRSRDGQRFDMLGAFASERSAREVLRLFQIDVQD